ncbi:thyroid adenoma-associated protein [Coregonus clupeaformis]|uniref:thyroid adenoma-associated protein n=1 Tax=Coregonus clupeaformis TaxID=59861 RepID=UPI001E1C8594|nr:thyroid adenoma-associated protein [Coregonus clupeaformis]XP_045067470.1 thyroid adenoma-associated protein [Coregonus clupeaformis]
MVTKKKTVKVEAVVLDKDRLDKLIASLSVDGGDEVIRQLAQTLQDCLALTDPVQQIQLVKKAGSQLELLSEEETSHGPLLQACLHTLALIYTSLLAKNPLRRASASALSSVPDWLQEQTVSCLSVCLSDCLSTVGSDHTSYPHMIDSITSCLDAFPLGERCIHGLLAEVLQFLHKALSEYLQLNSGLAGRHVVQAQLMHSCLAAVKASMLVVQRSQELISAALQAVQPHCTLQLTLSGLLDCYTHILTDEEFLQSVQSTAGMAVVLLTRSVMGSGDQMAEVVSGLLQGSEQSGECAPVWLRQSCMGLYDSGRPAGVSLYLCHGALAMLNWRGTTQGPQREQLLLLVPHILLALDTSIKESSTAMVVARVLTLWSGAALDSLQGGQSSPPDLLHDSLRGGSELQGHLLEHVYTHWEHPLDGVRHQTRALFKNLLLLHQHSNPLALSDPHRDPYITQLTHNLLGLEWHQRGKYGSLACLVELLGAGYLLALDPQLPSRLLGLMGDQTLAPYASDLLERLFVSHKAQLVEEGGTGGTEAGMERWHQTWVTPLLQVLCRARLDQTTYILDYFLPKLLRCSPSSLAHMVQALQDTPPCSAGPPGSRGAVGALMTCLRAARAQGVVQSEEGLWGGLVPLFLLRQALVHKHDQVRMDALGLLCESHRSTEVLTSQEMELLHHFLPSSLSSQSPGVRQLTISLLKKLLCRVKDSGQSLQRRLVQERDQGQKDRDQHTLDTYKEFLCWLCESLFMVLLPGASFSTCLTALHLLCQLAQLFTFNTGPDDVFALGEVVTPAHAQNVLYCVASNFLEVKQLASTLLRQLPPSAVGLQEPGRMQALLQAALDLSTSTKPFDSVTAAHLFNMFLHQPALPQALLLCAQEQGLSFQPPALTQPQAFEALTMEINTLAVVQFLLLCLKAEVVKAESSLLLAAASYPLYGRAHCITAALQQLNTGCLTLTGQWRSVVSELITVSYRMSDVVSPVVQSSSPEGLIPMDTDSETSAGLQRILQEIQPRDTNDFFTSARELDTQQSGQENGPAAPTDRPQHESTGGSGEGYRVTAQMVLVCCWRSMKEVSMVLGQVCQSLPLQTPNTHSDHWLITEEQVEGVGLYFRQQLLQSRHRGAFELAYVGFVRLTDMLCRSGSRTLQQLPARWLTEVLQEVKSSDPSSKLCATRRSAGIPFYIQALLSSEPKSSSCSLLKMTMRELTALTMPSPDRGTDQTTVPQVHALNILRALYRDTRLGENIVPFVSEGMQAAVLGFTSPVWAVRNSSTLLFSTLITRIFGVKKGKDEHSKENRMTGREFFTRFPALYPFLLSQLEAAAASVDSDSGQVILHPSLFLLLLVLGRLFPSPMDGSSSPLGLAPFMPFIIRCGRSAVYRTREMAARALVPFVMVTQVPSTIQTLLEDLPLEPGPRTQQNHIHGTLLQVLFLLRSYQTDTHRPQAAGSDISKALCPRLWLASRQNPCLVTRAVFVDVLGAVCGPLAAPVGDSELKELREETLALLMASELVTPGGPSAVCGPSGPCGPPGTTQYLLSLARLALSASVESPLLWGVEEDGTTSRGLLLLGCLLQCPHYEVRELALGEVLRRLERERDEGEEERDGEGERSSHWPQETIISNLTTLALHEAHPQSLAKVLQVLSVLSMSSDLQWMDGLQTLTQAEVLERVLTLAEDFAHSVELHCASLTLASRLVVHLSHTDPQGVAVVACLGRWGALVSQCCGVEQNVEVKMMAAEVLVNATPTLLTSPNLPLGVSHTVSLWRGLFTLLQDEDQDVRDRAADFISNLPTHLLNTDVACVSVCPPVALDMGVGLLCQLFQLWGQVPTGILTLTEWLLGDVKGDQEQETATVEAAGLDEEELLFEKGDLNLWAEPVQWARLLHRHLGVLFKAPGLKALNQKQAELLRLSADALSLATQQALDGLPALPQFSCSIEHTRLALQQERATLALDILGTLRQTGLSG